jgi:GGDEF domain-containing protein
MTDPAPSTPALLAGAILALDVIDEHVVLLDPAGVIVHANVAWQRFALNNGEERTDWVGVDYIAASSEPCASADIDDPITDGVRDVLAGRRNEFRHEYDCHAPDELRWFRLTAVNAELPGIAAVVTHTDITPQRMAERAVEHHATHDRITGTANRAALEQLLAQTIEEGLDASIIKVALADGDQHAHLLHDDTLRHAARILEELFPAPAKVGRWNSTTLLVAQAGHARDTLDDLRGILAETLGALDGDVTAEITARAIRSLADVDTVGASDPAG